MDRETYIHQISPTLVGWVKYEHNPVLDGDLGTCFDLFMAQREVAILPRHRHRLPGWHAGFVHQ